MQTHVVALTGLIAVVGACSSGSQGTEGQSCFPNGTCNAGLTCLSNLCVNAGADAGNDAAVGDASSDSPLDVATEVGADAGYQVASLPGLALWLDVTRGVTLGDGGTIASWTDQSVNVNVLTASPHPTGSISIDATAINGHPGMKIDGPADFYDPVAPTGFAWDNDDYLVEAVVSVTGTQRLFTLFENGKTHIDISINFAAGVPNLLTNGTGAPVNVVGPSALTGVHVLGMQQRASTLGVDLRVDGAVTATASGQGKVTGAEELELGFGGNAAGSNVEIAEMIVIHGVIADSERGKLEAYLKSRYGL